MGTIPPTNPLPMPRRDFDYRVIRPRELGMFLRDNSYCINIRAAPRLVRIDYWGPWSFEFRCRCWDLKIGSVFLAAGLEPMIRLSLHLWPGPRGTVYDGAIAQCRDCKRVYYCLRFSLIQSMEGLAGPRSFVRGFDEWTRERRS